MSRSTNALTILAVFFLVFGAALIVRAQHWPVYTDPKAWDRLADKWDPIPTLPAGRVDSDAIDRATDGWYEELETFESPHKWFFDLGCGLAGQGFGLLLALGASARLRRAKPGGRRRRFWLFWALAFIVPVIGDFWFYTVHAIRGDYPPWADSIMIGYFEGAVGGFIGWGVTSLILILLLARREMPVSLDFVRPNGVVAWMRFAALLVWQFLLVELAFEAIYPVGDPGFVAGITLQSALLLQVMSAPTKTASATSPTEAMQTVVEL